VKLRWLICLAGFGAACGSGSDARDPALEPPEFEPPVVTNPSAPVEYPPQLYEEGVEGVVMLRLFVDETGHVVPDSTRIEESSGHAELDSAALAGVKDMIFAPARRKGVAVAAPFLQPVHFRRPDHASAASGNESP
jgi:periplasmic protein TonB